MTRRAPDHPRRPLRNKRASLLVAGRQRRGRPRPGAAEPQEELEPPVEPPQEILLLRLREPPALHRAVEPFAQGFLQRGLETVERLVAGPRDLRERAP